MLLEENNSYIALPSGADSELILTEIISRNIRVILEVGALIIDRNNEQIANRWIELVSPQIAEAVVYFDSSDKLVVNSRGGLIRDFDTSPYALSLNRCLVYLDEFHTRGTDLRIPADTRAAITLGPDLPKDRLFQAAMRMRLLGAGHSISFVASHEVHWQIKTLRGSSIKSRPMQNRIIIYQFFNYSFSKYSPECSMHRSSRLYSPWIPSE